MWVPSEAERRQRASDPTEVELEVIVSAALWASVRVARDPNLSHFFSPSFSLF